MEIVEIVVIERIADHVRVLEVFDELVVAHVLAVRALESFEPARIDLKRRRWLGAQLGHVASIAVHVVVADHHTHAVLAHVASMAFVRLRVTSVAEFVAACQVPEAGAVLEEAVVYAASYRFRVIILLERKSNKKR